MSRREKGFIVTLLEFNMHALIYEKEGD